MPVYSIQAPDNKVYEVEAPEGASESETLEWFQGNWQGTPEPEKPVSEAKRIRGFMSNIRSPIELMKTESIPAHLIKWLSTSEKEYKQKELESKEDYIANIPAIQQISDRLDYIEEVNDPRLEEEHGKLIDAYGTLYQKLSKSYDKGELEEGFSWESFKEAVSDDPGGMLAELANTLMADPEFLLTPIGWEKAAASATSLAKTAGASEKLSKAAGAAGGIAGSSVLGASLGAADSASRQLSEKGKINPEQTKTAATIGGVAAPILLGGFKASTLGAKAINSANYKRQMTSTLKAVEDKAQGYLAKGLTDPKQAINRAINESFIPPKVRKELSKRHDWVDELNLSPESIEAKALKTAADAGKIKTKIYDGLGKGKKWATDLLGNLSTELGKIHPSLKHAVKKLDLDIATSLKKGLDVKDRFNIVFKGLSDSDRVKLNIHLGNGNRAGVNELINKSSAKTAIKSGIRQDIDKYFSDVFTRSEDAGMGIGKLQDFFPMEVKDYKGLSASLGYKPSYIKEQLSKAINTKLKLRTPETQVSKHISIEDARKYLDPDEFQAVMNKALAKPHTRGRGTARHTKSRTVEKYTPENIRFYADPIESFSNYVTSIEPRIAESMFFGGKKGTAAPHSEFISNSIGRMADDLLKSGKIIDDDIDRLTELMTTRFVQGTRAPSRAIAGFKNILYAGTLGNPLSAMTQLGDLGNSAYVTSVAETARQVPKVLGRKINIKMEDLGLNNIVQEFEHLGKTAKFLDASLKWSGFKAVDRLGKETVLNAAFAKHSKLAKTAKGRQGIRSKFKDAFTPDEMAQLFTDLAAKRSTPNVKYLLWHELARVQPISLSEMPVKYLQHPNGRIFYMLKTFTLKQLDLVRNEAYKKIRSGDVIEGVTNLVKWSAILGMSNAGIEQSKAWIRGEDVEFGDMFIAQLYRNYGLSQYVLDKAKQGNVFAPNGAVAALVLPPVGIIDDGIKDLANFGERFESLKHVPPFGKGLYYLMKEEER